MENVSLSVLTGSRLLISFRSHFLICHLWVVVPMSVQFKKPVVLFRSVPHVYRSVMTLGPGWSLFVCLDLKVYGMLNRIRFWLTGALVFLFSSTLL